MGKTTINKPTSLSKSAVPTLPTPTLPQSQVADSQTLSRKRAPKSAPTSKQIIRDLGLKVTSQRQVILEVVRAEKGHFTAQDIFESVVKRAPEVGFATVYRFLRSLSESGNVTEVRMGGMPARYEWAEKDHHDHLTCTACGKIVEFENDEIERLQERVASRQGFILTSHVLELYGICADCRKKGLHLNGEHALT
ncbi:MAG TPA: transcriptional repressor [Pseudobdellovibrionaceae bacterium]|nr:transcriptional repressor [Pseudobdellovibrionaceae bacterium]